MPAPRRVYLVESWFSDGWFDGHDQAGWPADPTLELELGASRREPRELTVLLTVITGEALPPQVRVTYACDYRIGDGVPDAEVDEWCESLVFDAAPALLYPYLRQEVARLTATSRPGTFPLPFLPPPLQRHEDFTIPGSGADAGGEEPGGTETHRGTASSPPPP